MESEHDDLQDLPLWNEETANNILQTICAKHGVPLEVLTELVQVQRERQHQERAHGIYDRFDEILGRMD